MIKREDMLELTRRMTPERTCFSRIAGAYVDEDGFVDGSFNIHFGKLKASEKSKNLQIAKVIPFSDTNEELHSYKFSRDKEGNGSMWQLLMALKQEGLKNDALLDSFYEYVGENIVRDSEYALYVFYGSYDVPLKGKDKVRQEESEEVYDFLICAVCPLEGEYEPGKPDAGFLFPAFVDRSADIHRAAIYTKNGRIEEARALAYILGCEKE